MPASEHLAQKDTVTVRGKCVIYTSEGNGVELRSFQKTLHNAPPDFENPLKREMQRKETAFIKPSATKERRGGRQFYGLSVPLHIRVLKWQD